MQSNEESKSAKTENSYGPPEQYVHDTILKVIKILDEHFPDYLNFGNGTFTITRGSTQVMVNIKHFLKDETMILCFSNVVTGAQVDPQLMHFLLRKNAELFFGHFSLLFDGTITYSHSIAGKNLDANELTTTLSSVAFIADYYDDIIVEMAGGKRAKDMFETIKAT